MIPDPPAIGLFVLAALALLLVPGPAVLYVGRSANLRDRLGLLARFGRGDAVGHWGGRYLWQLDDADRLLVAWQETADQRAREAELIADFEAAFATLPFANIHRPRGGDD